LNNLERNGLLAYFCSISSLHPDNYREIILWGDETFGRHALLSRGWGPQHKQSVEPTLPLVRPTRVDH